MYEMPCNNCGFCCLIQLCKTAQQLYGAPRNRRCPALIFEGNKSRCGVLVAAPQHLKDQVSRNIGAGEGCSISAKVRGADGVFYDFAKLPDEVKLGLADRQRNGEIEVRHRRKK